MIRVNFILLLLIGYFGKSQPTSLANLVMENIPEIPSALMEQMNQYQNTRSAVLLDWRPGSNDMLISTRFGETSQLHVLRQALGARKQITFFKEPVSSGSYCPDAAYKGIVYSKDIGGNEFSQLYWLDETTGKHSLLTDGERSQNSSPLWSNKGDLFVHTSTKRNKKDYDLYVVSMNSPYTSKLLLTVTGSWSPLDWSPDDKKLLVRQNISVNFSRLFILDIQTGKLEEINPSDEYIAYNGARWSADGRSVFIVNDEGAEFQTLKHYDLVSKKFKAITFSLNWDVHMMTISKKRDRLVFATNENGYDRLYELNPTTLKYTAIEGIPSGVITSLAIHPKGHTVGFSINHSKCPGDIYTYEFLSKKITPFTESETGGLNSNNFPAASLVHYETFDDVNGGKRKIPAFVYKPEQTKGKMAVVISIHGGPEGQSRPLFNSFTSFLTNELGVCVIQPNVRGSTGYGKTYVRLDNDYKREESVKDIGKLLDWIATQPDLDTTRIAVIGGSYGGYMSLASMTHYNNKLRCGVDVVGISNFVTFLKNTEDYRKDLRRVEYGDERIPQMNEFLEKISPSNHVSKISKPMLIVQGANDPRVPMSESEQIKKKLQAQNVETWYLLAKDEGHGFTKKQNVDYYQWAVTLFFQKFLLDQKTAQ